MISPLYNIPLPLYGSGGRLSLIVAANCPTSSLSKPVIIIPIFFSTLISIPKGIDIKTG